MSGRKEEAYFNEAERLYVQENKTPEQIAALLPVSQNTIYKWSLKGAWGKKRAAALASPKSLSEKMRRILEQKIEALEGEAGISPASFDAIYKAFCAIEKLERAQDLRVIGVEVMRQYTDFLRGQDIPPGELQMHGDRIRAWFRSLE